jgi:hypothetical protein
VSSPNVDQPDHTHAESLLAQALGHMQMQRWDESIRLLESAIAAALPGLRSQAVELLASLCVSRNEHARLRELVLRADPLSPQMVKAGLLLARNHAIGVDGELPAHCTEKSLGPSLRTHLIAGAYQPTELPVIVALLAQLKWAELAAEVAMRSTKARVGIEPGVVERVFAVLLGAGRRAEALDLLEALKALPESPDRPTQRWSFLLGAGGTGPAAGDSPVRDKVLRFLAITRQQEGGAMQPPTPPTKEPTPC